MLFKKHSQRCIYIRTPPWLFSWQKKSPKDSGLKPMYIVTFIEFCPKSTFQMFEEISISSFTVPLSPRPLSLQTSLIYVHASTSLPLKWVWEFDKPVSFLKHKLSTGQCSNSLRRLGSVIESSQLKEKAPNLSFTVTSFIFKVFIWCVCVYMHARASAHSECEVRGQSWVWVLASSPVFETGSSWPASFQGTSYLSLPLASQ